MHESMLKVNFSLTLILKLFDLNHSVLQTEPQHIVKKRLQQASLSMQYLISTQWTPSKINIHTFPFVYLMFNQVHITKSIIQSANYQ